MVRTLHHEASSRLQPSATIASARRPLRADGRAAGFALGVVFALAALLVIAAADAEELSTFLDSVDVRLVNVEVFVTDREGQPAEGLTRDDFVVEVDGQPVEITNFFVARPEATGDGTTPAVSPDPFDGAPGSMSPATAVQRRRPMFLAVYVDNVNLTPQSRKRVVEALRPLLHRRLEAGDQVMLLAYDRSLEVLEPFSRDPAALQAALDRLEKTATRRQEANSQLRWVMSDIAKDGTTGLPERVLIDNYQQTREAEALAAFQALRRAIVGLAGVPGRKALLYVSDGIPRYPGSELDQLAPEEAAVRAELPSRRTRRDLRSFYRDLFRQANAHEVTLYTMDARGPGEDFLFSAINADLQAGGREFAFSRDASLQEPIMELADQTGGQAILNTFNFAEVLEDVTRDFDSFYSLGFPAPDSDDDYHDVEVRVPGGRGLTVRHREGYLAKRPTARVADRTETFLLQGWQSNPMGVELQFGAPTKQRRHWKVPVLVRVPARAVTMIARGDEMAGRLQFFVAVRDGEGRTSEVTRLERDVRITTVELEKQQAEGKVADLGYALELEMRPGPQSMVVGVWDEVGGAESYVHQKVVIGGPS